MLLVAWLAAIRVAHAEDRPSVHLLHLPGIGGELGHDRRLVAALKQANPGWQVEIDDWTGGRRGLVALLDERGNHAEASRIARRLTDLRRADPNGEIVITAHSGGAGIAAWALERLPPDVTIDTLVLLAPALGDDYDLSPALRHVRKRAFVFCSRHDRIVLGLGTRLLGTIDRQFKSSGGYLGFRRPPGADEQAYRKLVEMPYRAAWLRLGNAGGHVDAMHPRFVSGVLAPLLLSETSALPGPPDATTPRGPRPPTGPRVIGRIEAKLIPESSGIIGSRRHRGVYWTINDSGNGPELFAIDRNGRLLATVRLAGVRNIDFEDLADDAEGRIYVADVGNNDASRQSVQVHRFVEPEVLDDATGIEPQESWELRYPDRPFDCEALFTWNDRGYLVSKRRDLGKAGLYEFDLDRGGPQVLKKIADLPILAPVTSADISHDGTRVAIGTVGGVLLFRIEPGEIGQLPRARSSVAVFLDRLMEAVCFDREGILATTENRVVLLFGWELFAEDVRP